MTEQTQNLQSRSSSSRRIDRLLVVLLIGAIGLCFADVLTGRVTFFYQDIQFLHYPGKIYLVRSLLEGNYAFWSPHIFGGYPLQSEPEVGPLYPFNLLFALPLAPHYAQTLFVVLHYAFAAVFTFLLSRRLSVSSGGAFVAGLVYAGSGYLMAQLTNFSILTAVVWLPLILLLSYEAIETGRFRYAAGAGIVLALFMLTSHPQFMLLTFTTLGLFYLYHLARRWSLRGALRGLLLLLVTVLVGAGLAAPQLWPAWELKGLSVLSESLGYDFVTSYSLSPYRMVSFLVPNFLGNQATGYRGPAFFEEHHNYIGLLPLLLVALSWGRRRDRNALFFGILMVLSLVMAWGRSNPAYGIVASLPLFNLFRVPARWLYPMTMALAVLAGFGWDRLIAARPGLRFERLGRRLLTGAAIVTLALPWLFLVKDQVMQATGWFVDHVYPSYAVFTLRTLVKGLIHTPELPPANWLAHAFPFLLNPLVFLLVMLDLSALLVWLLASGRLSPRRFQVLGIALIALDLFLVGGSNVNPVEPASYFDRRPTTSFLQANLGHHRVLPINQDGDPNLNLGHYFPLIDRVPSFGGSSSLTVRWYKDYREAAARNPRLWDLAGVRYAVNEETKAPEGFSAPLTLAYEADGLRVWENHEVMPRAFVVHAVEVADSESAMLARLSDPTFSPDRTVLLDDPAAPRLPSPQAGEGAPAGEPAEIAEHSYNRVTVRAATPRPGYLLLSDSYYPGWTATVDGQPAPLYRADHLFRAVYLPAGDHAVVFTFTHPAFTWGVRVALLTAVLLAAAGAAAWLRAGRRDALPQRQPAL